jgi:succinoglycan biosynthesis protein ExoM
VADNDEHPEIKSWVLGLAIQNNLRVEYVHAPARNISIARNACLEAASAPFIAFIDDDEEASSNWLSALLQQLDETGADIVLGPVEPEYGEDAPAWMKVSRLHETRPTIGVGGQIETGYTCNMMLRYSVLGGLKFLNELGRTGGEDTVFFAELHRRGARLTFAESAVVRERIPPVRLRLGWLVSRAFRAGQTHGRLLMTRPGGGQWPVRMGDLLLAFAKCLYSLGQAAVSAHAPVGWRRGLIRASLHIGWLQPDTGRQTPATAPL